MDRSTIIRPARGGAFAAPYRRWKNHPVAGVDFPDTGSITSDRATMRRVVDALAEGLPTTVDTVAGIDMGGLGFAGALAQRNAIGFLDVRKVGSLRADIIRTVMANYELGDGIAISKASRLVGCRVAILDDCLISGGTALNAVKLIRRLGAECATALFVFELEGMGGRERLDREGVAVHALGLLPRAEAASAPGGASG